MSRRTTWIVRLSLLALVCVIASFQFIPEVSQGEIAAARERVTRVRATLVDQHCHRPAVLEEGAHPLAIEQLLSGQSPLQACMDAVREFDASADFRRPREELTEEALTHLSALEAPCDSFRDALRRYAGERDTCSPFALDRPLAQEDSLAALHPLLALIDSVSAYVHGSSRDRDGEGSLDVLVAGFALMNDVRMGPTMELALGVSVSAGRAWIPQAFNTIALRAPQGEDADSLDARARDVLAIASVPFDTRTALITAAFAHEAEFRAGGGDISYWWTDFRLQTIEEGCPEGASNLACGGGVVLQRALFQPAIPAGLRWLAGPRLRRDDSVALVAHTANQSAVIVAERVVSEQRRLRQLALGLALAAERERGRCPDQAQLDESWLAPPDQPPFEIVRDGDDYRIVDPFDTSTSDFAVIRCPVLPSP